MIGNQKLKRKIHKYYKPYVAYKMPQPTKKVTLATRGWGVSEGTKTQWNNNLCRLVWQKICLPNFLGSWAQVNTSFCSMNTHYLLKYMYMFVIFLSSFQIFLLHFLAVNRPWDMNVLNSSVTDSHLFFCIPYLNIKFELR